MTHINEHNPEKILLFGDIHGSVSQAGRALDLAQEAGVKVLVQLGDFGIWPGEASKRFLDEVSAELVTRDLYLYFVDGNHEDFPQLYAYPLAEDGTRPVRDRLAHLPRGLRWEWQGVKFGALGGAHSVDADYRVLGQSRWEEEHVTPEEAEFFRSGGPVDVVLMHDSPAGAPNSVVDDPNDIGKTLFSQVELYEAALHRRLLAAAVNPTRPRYVWHGHYHKYMTGAWTIDGASRETLVVGLNQGTSRSLSQFARVWDVKDALL